MVNIERFRKLHDRFTAEPRSLDMDSWESVHPCETTRCAAGWTIFDETGQPLFLPDGETLDASVVRLAESLMVSPWQTPSNVITDVATELLGLDADTAYDLFHSEGYMAHDVVEHFAHGREAEAMNLLNEEDDVPDSEYNF